MILNGLIVIASVLMAVLYYKISFKDLVRQLSSSYKSSAGLVLNSESSTDQQDLLMGEVKTQFKLLGTLLFRFILLIAPAILLILFMHWQSIALNKLLELIPLLLSLIAFLIVYLINKYAVR